MTEAPPTDELQADLDEALLALEELLAESPDEAVTMYDSLPEEVRARPEYRLTLARAHQSLEELQAARDIAQEILDELSDTADESERGLLADTHHFLGDVLEDLGETSRANEHFLRTLALDAERFEPESAPTVEELIEMLRPTTERSLRDLPSALREQVRSIIVETFPTTTQVEQGLDPRAYCHLDRSGTSPHRLFVFAGNLDAEYGDLPADELCEAITQELAAEIDSAG